MGRCPIHQGRKTRFEFYLEGHTSPGYWECYTQGCHGDFTPNIIGLVQGVLTGEEYGWPNNNKKMVSWWAAVYKICEILGVDYDTIKPDLAKSERISFIKKAAILTYSPEVSGEICTRSTIKRVLSMPAEYFIDRGYTREILDEYCIGYCDNPKQSLYERCVVPFFDNHSPDSVIGLLGRSIYPECEACKSYHFPALSCPDEGQRDFAKWKVSRDFNDKNHLFNLWNCRDIIFKKRSIVVVEGVLDLLKLRMAGIDNVVAVLGNHISDAQKILFEMSGATSIVCLSDNDESGENLYNELKKKCVFQTKIIRPEFDGHDVGELSVDYIKNNLKHIVESLCKK